MSIRAIHSLDIAEQRVLIRTDFNVPLVGTTVGNDHRIRAALPTINHALQENAGVVLVSHLGRPKPGSNNDALSLRPVAEHLGVLLNRPVACLANWQDGLDVQPGSVTLLENIRFHAGETQNDERFSAKLGALCDIYVNDAFGTAHRAHASTDGITRHVKQACAGFLLEAEISALDQALERPVRPLVAVIGGAKIAGKLELIHHLAGIADKVLVGGGMANTLLYAAGFNLGASLFERELQHEAAKILEYGNVTVPVDLMTAQTMVDQHIVLRLPESMPEAEMTVDIGPETARRYAATIAAAGTVIWNGPMGVFEHTAFAVGTRDIAVACAESQGFTLAGGGDTIAALEQFDVADQLDYISTGGGAFLEYVAGKNLPAIEALR